MDYKNKYLKYKLKYLKLIQSSGNIPEEEFKHNCFTKIFENYQGECWNNSIQTLLTFTEPFIKMQKKAIINYNSTIEFLVDRMILDAFTNRLHLKPLHLKEVDIDNDNIFKQYIRGYIIRILKRFKIIYNTNYPNLRNTKQISDENLSITCALNALKFSEINKIIINNNNKNRNRNNHGGQIFNDVFTLNSLSFILLENNNFINIDLYQYKSNYEIDNNLKIDNIDLIYNIDINKYFGLNLSSNEHSFCVYKCPENKMYYYDDNNIESIEFDWITYFKKNHKTLDSFFKINKFIESKEYHIIEPIIKHVIDNKINKWKYCQIIFLINDNRKTRLGYFNKELNQLLIYDHNLDEYKLYNNYIKGKHLIIDQLNNIKIIGIELLLDICALYIDTALNREEYIRKLKLEYFLYTNNYNIKIAKAYAIHNFPIISINDSDEHKKILYVISYLKSALILNHENIINKISENSSFLKKINIETNKPYFFEIYIFNNISIIKNFILKMELDLDQELLFNYIYQIIIKNNNSIINIELFETYNKNIYFKDKFKDNIIKIINNIYYYDDDNDDDYYYDYSKDLILYFIENNTNNILSINFTIYNTDYDKDNNNNNNVMILYYLLWKCQNLNKKYKFINDIITYFDSNWKSEYKILFENIDVNETNILYDIFYIEEKHKFKLIDKLYKLQTENKINIFNYFLEYYSISYLTPISQITIEKIVDELIINTNYLKYIKKNIKKIIKIHKTFFKDERNIIQKDNIKNFIGILENIRIKINK